MTHAGHTRNFDSTLRSLAERGHEVIVAVDQLEKSTQPDLNDQLLALVSEFPGLTWEQTPARAEESWSEVGRLLRLGLDYLRYLRPEYVRASRVRDRARRRAPEPVRRLSVTPGVRRLLGPALRLAEASIPVPRELTDFISERAPDVVLVTPLVELGSPQVDYLRAARALRIPSALLVASWDNLTVKGGIHELPDLVAVWNEAQKREACELHGVPADRVAVTGAVAYDHWFDWQPSTTREEFCLRVGLDPGRPYVLYAGSSKFIAPREGRFVLEWVKALRSERSLKKVQVMVRPHPTNSVTRDGIGERLTSRGALVVHPSEGANPTDDRARADYFDTIWHSAAVVGVNTSAMIEAAIVGRPVHTLLSKQYRSTQLDTLHFRYLLRDNGGFLEVAKTAAEHAGKLHSSLKRPEAEARAHHRRFVESFIRPYGLDAAAVPRLVAALEHLAGQEARGPSRPVRRALVGRPLAVLARVAARPGIQRRAVEREASAEAQAVDGSA